MKLPRLLGALFATSAASVRMNATSVLVSAGHEGASVLVGTQDFAPEADHPRLVMMDWDDTVVCSGGTVPKGVDEDCDGTQKHDLYPGVAAFLYALGLGTEDNWGAKVPEAIPLSARPAQDLEGQLGHIGESVQQGFGAIVPQGIRAMLPAAFSRGPQLAAEQLAPRFEDKLSMKRCSPEDLAFRHQDDNTCGCKGGEAGCEQRAEDCSCFGIDVGRAMYGKLEDSSTIAGDLKALKRVNWQKAFEKFGDRKFTNWDKAKFQHPVFFVGDNGQGDVMAAKKMHEKSADMCPDPECPGKVLATFIHDVTKECHGGSDLCFWKDAEQHGIYYFTNYLQAANMAMTAGFISLTSYDEVAKRYDADFQGERKGRRAKLTEQAGAAATAAADGLGRLSARFSSKPDSAQATGSTKGKKLISL